MLKVERLVRTYLLRRLAQACAAERRAPWFFQVGANDGMTDDPMHQQVRQHGWRGALVEPNPAVHIQLRANYADVPDLQFFDCAVSDQAGEAEFMVPENSRVASLAPPNAAKHGPSTAIRVRTQTLAALLEQAALPHLDLLVIDAEGHDARILAPLDLARYRPRAVIFESHHLSAPENAGLRAKFEAAGYAVLHLHADSFAVLPEVMEPAIAGLLQNANALYTGALREKRVLERAGRPRARVAPLVAAAPTAPLQPIGPVDPARNPLRDWYFCVNERGLQREFASIQVAVASARLRTSLVPHCIYDGPDCAELDWLQRAGVDVIRHTPSLGPELAEAYGEKYDIFRGHWLRLDLPVLAPRATQALYTDIDVMFLGDPCAFAFRPRYLTVCEEAELGDRSHFNSGAMVLNLPALRAVRPWLLRAVRERLAGDFRYPSHDQKSLNDFFLADADWMRPAFNWKPYWGVNAEAVIVHFHGPKPGHVVRLRDGREATMKPAFKVLHDRSPEGYDVYGATFHEFRRAAGEMA